MALYKDTQNNIHDDDNGRALALPSWPKFGLTKITQAEADAIRTPSLSDQKISKWEEIKSYRDKVKAGGVLVSTKWFHTDDASRIQQLGLVMMGVSLPAGIMWKTMDGTFIEMTQQLALDIFNAVAALDTAAFSNAETHRAAMEASQTPSTYDYSAGWPTTYLYG